MFRAVRSPASALGTTVSVLATGFGYYVAAWASLELTLGGDGIATLWPAGGILLAAFLIAPRRHAAWHLAAAAVASMAANVGAGNAATTSFGFTLANVGESLLAAWWLRTRMKHRVSFSDPAGLVSFCKVALLAAMGSATLATCFATDRLVSFWPSWFASDLLGMLVVTPLILVVRHTLQRHRPEPQRILEGGVVLALVTLVAGLTFWQSSYPLLFVPMLTVIVAVFRLGPLGATASVLIVAVVSSIAINLGLGPAALIHIGPLGRSLFVQFYLLTLFAAGLPVATLLAMRGRLLDRLSNEKRLLQLAESAAQVGHWRLDLAEQTVTWSREVFRIHGLPGTTAPPLERAIDAYHPDDRAMVADRIGHAIAACEPFEFMARIVRPDGEVRHVFSRGEIDRITDDGSFGLFGIIQDVTARMVHEAALKDARLRAEDAARAAMVMAETDALTGIANRRRTVAVLEHAILVARRSQRPVSVAIFDIDHFKRINDRYGHLVGDMVLQRVAASAAQAVRSADVVGRFGGEEFVIVLPDAAAEAALEVAERVRRAVEGGGDDPRATISVGVAQLAADESSETLLKRADQALYVAKREGRNVLRLAA